MYQTFENLSEPQHTPARIAALRAEMARQGLDGFIVPRQDEFQGEYVAAYAERLRWLTGFAGSWGMAIILAEEAAIFVDGRYTIQVQHQVDTHLITPRHLNDEPPQDWIAEKLKPGQKLGFDPWLITADQAARFATAAEKAGASLVPVTGNLVDAVWTDQPARPANPISVQPTQFAGTRVEEKLANLAADLQKRGADAVVLTLPDSVAWAFNIRGSDVPHTPVVLAHALITKDATATLFIDTAKLPEDVKAHLAKTARIAPPAALEAELKKLGDSTACVLIDPTWAADGVRRALSGAKIMNAPDPCILPKARKNNAEREGARAAHRRDGAAMSRFLRWLEIEAPKGKLTEIAVVEALEAFRRDTEELKDVSFKSIAGAGPHAAIPHYSVSAESNLPLELNRIFLIDSGGQYVDGTTDITRTVIVGTPTAEMKDRFTRVLKGMISLSMVRFPKGTVGSQIDMLARAALWNAGLDYDHGTGHGVGSFLSVHEGPARINKTDRVPLEPGMILSNEPGFYRQGEYGIRLENLVLITEPQEIPGGERPMMAFETLTLCPIDRRLMDVSLLSPTEHEWLNAYHARVLKEVDPLLTGDDATWLAQACAPL
jgi:Xaa-Pro aminopeptidase